MYECFIKGLSVYSIFCPQFLGILVDLGGTFSLQVSQLLFEQLFEAIDTTVSFFRLFPFVFFLLFLPLTPLTCRESMS